MANARCGLSHTSATMPAGTKSKSDFVTKIAPAFEVLINLAFFSPSQYVSSALFAFFKEFRAKISRSSPLKVASTFKAISLSFIIYPLSQIRRARHQLG